MADGFLGRWSQRKQDVRQGKPLAEPAAPSPVLKPAVLAPAATPSTPSTLSSAELPDARSNPLSPESPIAKVGDASQTDAPGLANQPTPPELPTLADTQSLTPESDFKPFMARGVSADVKNAAMKKLFADPHFNVMDRLDTYIDDYSLPDPIPQAMLRQMVSAQFLNLFDEEKKADAAREGPDTAAAQIAAQSAPTLDSPETYDDDPDLRLQPDHAPERPGAGPGAA